MRLSELIRLALEEDVGPGDLTTEFCVGLHATGEASVTAKEPLVVCGHPEAEEVFRQVGVHYIEMCREGQEVRPGEVVARVRGPTRGLRTGERVALNLLMRLCGVATQTRQVISALGPDRSLHVVDTRKTTPLLRASERRAVRVGGAANHRFALYDGVLIKDNHIVAAGGVRLAVLAARSKAHHLLRVEVEVGSAEQAREAVEAGADVVMLDNMDDDAMAAVIEELRADGARVLFEASGNVTAERLPRLQAIGVDIVSIGGLIHQARWADLSMKLTG